MINELKEKLKRLHQMGEYYRSSQFFIDINGMCWDEDRPADMNFDYDEFDNLYKFFSTFTIIKRTKTITHSSPRSLRLKSLIDLYLKDENKTVSNGALIIYLIESGYSFEATYESVNVAFNINLKDIILIESKLDELKELEDE